MSFKLGYLAENDLKKKIYWKKHLIASENMDLFFTLTCRESRAFAEIILELS